MIHAGKLSLDVLFRVWKPLLDPRNVQIDTAVRAPAALFDLAHDAAGYVVAGEEFRRTPRVLIALSVAPALFFAIGGLALVVFGDLFEHEPLLHAVQQQPALAAHSF